MVLAGSVVLIAVPALVRSSREQARPPESSGAAGTPGTGAAGAAGPSGTPARTPGVAGVEGLAPTADAGGAQPSPTVDLPATENAALVAAARAAIEAWGRFAATGDLAAVEGPFAPGGPQFERFTQEAAGGPPSAGPPAFSLLQASVLDELPGGDRVVRTEVDVTVAPGESPRRYRWDLLLRRDAASGAWQVWNVREAP